MDLHGAADAVGLWIDGVGVAVIVLSIVISAERFAQGLFRRGAFDSSYRQLRQSIGRGTLLGLELLVAGDIIRTVAIAPTFSSIGLVAMIVAIRTFLSFSLELELTGRLPWQPRPSPGPDIEIQTSKEGTILGSPRS